MTEIGSASRPLRVAIVGSGPAGFYAAAALLKYDLCVEVDVFDRLPTPYGLVRAGVAPDHQSIKNVTRLYERIASHERFRFVGNVEVGRDVQVDDLHRHYDQVLFAVGTEANRRLNIEGEGLWRCTPASVVVGWYNGHPDFARAPIDLSRVRRVAVVGNGNVAVDVARIFLRDRDELSRTDISAQALEVLRASAVEEVVMLGRRGPVQAAFTPAELRELGESAHPLVDPADLILDPISTGALKEAGRDVRRNLEILRGFSALPAPSSGRRVRLRFCVSPEAILADDQSGVRAVRLTHNDLVMQGGRLAAVPNDSTEEVPVDMVVPAVGFVGVPLPGLPFDYSRRHVANRDGQVVKVNPQGDPTDEPLFHTFVVGWARTGARGLLGSHKRGSAEVAAKMVQEVRAGLVPVRDLPDRGALIREVSQRGVAVFGFSEWRRLDRIEQDRGERRGAPRDKLTDVREMLERTKS